MSKYASGQALRASLPGAQPGEVLQQQWRRWIRHYGSTANNTSTLETTKIELALPELVQTYEPEGLEMTFGQYGGMTATVRDDGTIHVTFEASFVTEETWHAGSIARSLDTRDGVVRHDALLLDETLQNQGISARMMRRSLDLYDALGMDEIRVRAQMSGRYVWSRFGFDFVDEDEAQNVYWLCKGMYERMRRFPPFPAFDDLRHPWDYAPELDLDDMDREVTVARDEVADAHGPGVLDDAARSRMPAEMPMSMALLAFGTVDKWHGVLDLDTESPARRELLSYLDSKNV
jgi:GNAT superfamily N-acetyltransferase